MFKKHSLQVSVVKTDPKTTSTSVDAVHLDPEAINKIAEEQIHNIAVNAGAAIVATIFAGATADIIKHIAKTKIK